MSSLIYIDSRGQYGDADSLILLNLASIPDGERLFEEALDQGSPIRAFVYQHDWDVRALTVTESTMIFSPAQNFLQEYENVGGRA